MVDRLKAAGVEATLVTFDNAGHGFKGDDAKKAEGLMVEFFDKHLHPQPLK
jgi:dipeptidyl aminopeptidase/acylaminoacyl peptidase